MSMVWVPVASDVVHQAEPVVVVPGPIGATASGPHSVVAPSEKVRVAVLMSPGSASPTRDQRLSWTVARRRTVADVPFLVV